MTDEPQYHFALSPSVVCFGLWSNGVLTTSGDAPPCRGVTCSSYPMCLRERMKAIHDIEMMERGETPEDESEDD